MWCIYFYFKSFKLVLVKVVVSFIMDFSSFNPPCSSTFSQRELNKYLFFFKSYIFPIKSTWHSFRNCLKNLIFVSLFTHNPSFRIRNFAVGAFIINVRNAQPEVLNKLAIRKVGDSDAFDAKINVKAIPTAPRRPPCVRAMTSFHRNPYPYDLSFHMKTVIERNLASIM